MIIKTSDQLPGVTLLKRFPVPRNFGVSPSSRIERGKTWPAPAGATRVRKFEIYRYDPELGRIPGSTLTRSISIPAEQWFWMR